MSSENQAPWVLIVVTTITVVGTLGAAIIGNWDKFVENQDTQVVESIETEKNDTLPPIPNTETTDLQAEAPSPEMTEQFMVNMPSDPAPVSEATANYTPVTPMPDTKINYAQRTQSPQQNEFPQTVRLAGKDPGSRVNLRPEPSTKKETGEYGLVGDTIVALRTYQVPGGRTWYYVRFPSEAEGWIREDFIEPIN